MKTQAAADWTELAGIVGAENLRPAAPSDAIDGVAASKVIEPGSAEELAQVLRWANAADMAVIPRGSGTKLAWGNRPRRADLILSTARLGRVLEHASADMTATVEAGCTVERFQKTLAEHGQRLALDPLWPARATIGGILATNDSGALRVRFGALRDLIIGITLALPDGTLAKSGGKVVKNVAGYDLPKLATGSLGTLGVITQAIFRLHPLPRETRTISFSAPGFEALGKLLLAVLDSRLAFTGLQLRAQSTDMPRLDVRFEGTSAGIDAQEQQMAHVATSVTPANAPAEIWTARETLWQGAEPAIVAKFSVLPVHLSMFCGLVQRISQSPAMVWKIVAQSIGVGQVRLEGPNVGALLSAASSLRAELAGLGGTLVILQCPPEMKSRLDAWGPAGDAQPLMQRVKEQLDPAGILNPGRFVGGI